MKRCVFSCISNFNVDLDLRINLSTSSILPSCLLEGPREDCTSLSLSLSLSHARARNIMSMYYFESQKGYVNMEPIIDRSQKIISS